MRRDDRDPKRISDPSVRVRSYVDRRSGGLDAAKERRKQRARARSGAIVPSAAVQALDADPASGDVLDGAHIYRVAGSPEKLVAQVRDGAGVQQAAKIHTSVSGVTVAVRTNTGNVTVGNQATVLASCNAGEVATGGGGLSSGTGSTTTMIASTPQGNPPTGWNATFFNNSGVTDTITAYVVCLS